MQYNIIHYKKWRDKTTQASTIQYNTIKHKPTQGNTIHIKYNATHFNTRQYNTASEHVRQDEITQ